MTRVTQRDLQEEPEPAEVMHYTTAQGLLGIIENGELWATRSDFLNDREEREGFHKYVLPKIATAVVETHLPNAGPADQTTAASDLTNRLRALAAEDQLYFASLCHCPPYDPHHGLLSQWRGYGKDGGYAVVFARDGLERALIHESMTSDYLLLKMGDVAYYGDDGTAEPTEVLTRHERAIANSLSLQPAKGGDSVLEAFVMSSALYKHRGFREEAEVRIVAAPASKAVRVLGPLAGRQSRLPEKQIKFRERDGLIVPYLTLNLAAEQHPSSLPIRRIIVGPHPDADRRRKAVEALLQAKGMSTLVVTSGIPFVG